MARTNSYALVSRRNGSRMECLKFNASSPLDALETVIVYYRMKRHVYSDYSELETCTRIIDDNRGDTGIIVYAVIYKGNLIYTDVGYTNEIDF